MDEKSNEIPAIPLPLEALNLSGSIVTIDAMVAQRGIAQMIGASGADYVLVVKDNQPMLADSHS